ncbi:MAG: tetratricopeptide repeat protein, partial [Nitrospirales bacterium]
GVGHYEQGHWDESAKHFRKAVSADPKLAIAHFNLALALDKMGDHGKATEHFKKAAELAPDNPKIVNSEILKQHTKM